MTQSYSVESVLQSAVSLVSALIMCCKTDLNCDSRFGLCCKNVQVYANVAYQLKFICAVIASSFGTCYPVVMLSTTGISVLTLLLVAHWRNFSNIGTVQQLVPPLSRHDHTAFVGGGLVHPLPLTFVHAAAWAPAMAHALLAAQQRSIGGACCGGCQRLFRCRSAVDVLAHASPARPKPQSRFVTLRRWALCAATLCHDKV